MGIFAIVKTSFKSFILMLLAGLEMEPRAPPKFKALLDHRHGRDVAAATGRHMSRLDLFTTFAIFCGSGAVSRDGLGHHRPQSSAVFSS